MEDGSGARLLYFGEIHEKIKVFNLVIDQTSFVEAKQMASVKFKVKKHGLSFLKGLSEVVIPFKEFAVKPLSAQTVKVVDKCEIHLRLELGSIKETSFEELNLQNELLSKPKEEQVLNIQCKNCQAEITLHDRKFSRMLELPSENWQDYLDNWCCHGNEAIAKLKDGLSPRNHDCFFGNWYILVHPQALCVENVDVEENESCPVRCRRCQAELGKLNFSGDDQSRSQSQDINNSASVQLYKHSISLHCIVDSIPRDIFKNFGEEMYLSRNFISLTKTHMCHKFIINKTSLVENRKDSSVVLLWILNSDTKFVSSLHRIEVDCQSNKDSANIFSAVKVLYRTYLEDGFKKLKDEWYRNAQTDIVMFPEEICLKLLLFLNENNKIQPPSLRTANGFNVSFLKF